MSYITDNVDKFHQLAQICLITHQRAIDSLTLLCVSKNHTEAVIRDAYLAGERHFGENRVKEAVEKITRLADLPDLIWHYIGVLQQNKIKTIAKHFAWVQSVTRLSEAQRFAQWRPAELPPLNICIQVNIDNEPQKSGVAKNNVLALAQAISTLPKLRLRGLMALPRRNTQTGFACMQALFLQLQNAGLDVDTLSMGMSADWQQAIAHGATMVRLGTAIFGERR